MQRLPPWGGEEDVPPMQRLRARHLGAWQRFEGREDQRVLEKRPLCCKPTKKNVQKPNVFANMFDQKARKAWQGPPARCPFSPPFFGWEGSPKIDDRKSWYPCSKLSTGGPRWAETQIGKPRKKGASTFTTEKVSHGHSLGPEMEY